MRAVRLAGRTCSGFPSATRTSVRVVLSTNQKGAIAEAQITAAAIELGIPVLKPVIEGLPYDLVLELGARLVRAQCKWANRENDVVRRPESAPAATRRADTCSRRTRRGGDRRHRRLVPGYCGVLLRSRSPTSTVELHAPAARAGSKQPGAPCTLGLAVPAWGYSSAGRASGWQPEGRGFEPP